MSVPVLGSQGSPQGPLSTPKPSSLYPLSSKGIGAETRTIATVSVLTVAVFLIDIATPPDDVSVSFLYTIPIFLTIFLRRGLAYVFACIATILSCIGAFIQTPGEALDVVFFANRAISIIAQWLGAFLVTTRKDAEALMEAEFEEQKAKVETSRRFMDVLSHEIGTSLTMIDGQAFRLRKLAGNDTTLDATIDVAGRADKIRQAVRQIEAVVLQVQLASEVGEGPVFFQPVAVPLAALVEDTVVQADSTRTIHTDLQGLPEIVWGDADMLRQVVANLLSNAIKYSPPTTPIDVIGRTDQEMAVLSIVDRGRGIPEDETIKLTEPYYRARNARGVHGTGLGLYVTARYVASHAGAMDIKSELGAGTTVTVRIPIKQTPVEDRRDATAHPLH